MRSVSQFEQKPAMCAKMNVGSAEGGKPYILPGRRDLLFKTPDGLLPMSVAGLVALLIVSNAGAAGFFYDNFESYPALPTNVVDIGHGWGASSPSVVVNTVTVTNGSTKAAIITPGEILTNGVNSSANPNRIWTDFLLSQTNFMTLDTLSPVDTAKVFMVAIATNGYLYACNPTSFVWEVCLTDAVGVAVGTAVATGTWARISVFQNYSNHTVEIFLNDRLLRKDWPFINTNLNTYNRLKFEGSADGSVYVDNVFVSNSTPPGLVSDSDGDGRPDADEYTLFGSLANWSGSRLTASVTNNIGGAVWPTDTGVTIRWQGQTNFVLAATNAYVLGQVWTNGVQAHDYSSLQQKTATFVWSNVVADGTLTAGFSYNGIRYVPGDYSTLTAAVASALAGDRIVVSNGAYSESVTVGSNLTFVGTNLTGLTALTVQTGVTAMVVGFTNLVVSGAGVQVRTNGVLVLSNSVVDLGTLALQYGATVHGYNSTATVNGVVYTGDFNLDQNWAVELRAQSLNLTEGFETYAYGTRLDHLGYFGWNANGNAAAVTNNPGPDATNATARVAVLPAGAIASNLVNGAGLTNIWTDLMIRVSDRTDCQDLINTNGTAPVMWFVNTNGYLTVLTPSGWVVCSHDIGGAQMTMPAGAWAEISWFMDFSKTTVAYFVNGRLVGQQLPFAHPVKRQYNSLKLEVQDATAWIDNVNILTNVPPGLTSGPYSDLDHDGIPDALEIQIAGSTATWPHGAVFKIR